MTKVKAVIIGMGRIGYSFEFDKLMRKPASHYGAYKVHPEVELVAVADTDKTKLPITAKIEGIAEPEVRCYLDYEKMLTEEHPNIVSVCTPAETHVSIVRNVVRYDGVKAIFCEKPIATTVEDAERMIRTCKEFKVTLGINHTRRWDERWLHFSQLLNRPIAHMDGYYSGDPLEIGTHMADTLDMLNSISLGYINLIRLDVKYLLFEVQVFGDDYRYIMKDNGRTVERYGLEKSRYYAGINELGKIWEINTDEWAAEKSPMYSAIDDMVICARNPDRLPRCGGVEGLRALKLVLGVQ